MADFEDDRHVKIALHAGKMHAFDVNVRTGEAEVDPGWRQMMGFSEDKDVTMGSFMDLVHPEDQSEVETAITAAIATEQDYMVEFRVCRPTGDFIWVGARGRVVGRDDAGNAEHLAGVNWDITKEHDQTERLAMIASEMDHRVKNSFASIKALILLGKRLPGDKDDFADTLAAQVQALADAHSLSARIARDIDRREGVVPIANIVRSCLGPWAGNETNERVRLQISEKIGLDPRRLSALSMLLYEFTTNATKYGVLGARDGKLRVVADVLNEDCDLVLRWNEVLDEPLSSVPQDRTEGFGTTLIKHCANMLNAEIKHELKRSGFQASAKFRAIRC